MVELYRTRGLFFQATPRDFVTTGDGAPDLTREMLLATEWCHV